MAKGNVVKFLNEHDDSFNCSNKCRDLFRESSANYYYCVDCKTIYKTDYGRLYSISGTFKFNYDNIEFVNKGNKMNEKTDLYKHISKGDVMNASKNGAGILVKDKKDDGDTFELVVGDDIGWDWNSYDFIIANKTADGLLFHEFADKIESQEWQKFCNGVWKDQFVSKFLDFYIANPSQIKDLRLKPKEPEYTHFEWKDRDELRDKWIKLSTLSEYRILGFHRYDDELTIDISGSNYGAKDLFKNATFIDGSVFGKVKE